MISLEIPQLGTKYYAQISRFLVGPFSAQGPREDDFYSSSYRSVHDSLRQGDELFHENKVDHVQHQGSVKYLPQMSDVTRTPTSTYPQRITFNRRNFSGSTMSSPLMTCDYGLLSAFRGIVSQTAYTRTLLYMLEATPQKIVYLSAAFDITKTPVTNTNLTHIKETTLVFSRVSGSNIYYVSSELDRYPVRAREYVSDWSELTADLLPSIWEKSPQYAVVAPKEMSPIVMYQAYTGASLSVQSTKEYLETVVVPSISEINIPLEEEDYGALAGKASQKVNANQTNMVAFFKDLRRPQDMIPKLKNLDKLNKNAGNFLAVQYGILPTISDLKEIFGAMKRNLPYLDRHGFKTYTAAHSVSSSSGSDTREVTQRIKLAIADEDSDYERLSRKIESMGFMLTFENVWDLIPYSFVVDWFIDIGGFLERGDSRLRLVRLDIQYATMSYKEIKEKKISPSQTYPLDGTIKRVSYSRWTQDHCPLPPLFSQTTPTVSNHWLEAGALYLQRTKI